MIVYQNEVIMDGLTIETGRIMVLQSETMPFLA
jgi:hypothetical protein